MANQERFYFDAPVFEYATPEDVYREFRMNKLEEHTYAAARILMGEGEDK